MANATNKSQENEMCSNSEAECEILDDHASSSKLTASTTKGNVT